MKKYSSLADYLEHSGETQEQLAARLKVSQPSISLAKRGKGSYRLFKKIHEATGVPLESFGGEDAVA